MKIAYLTNCFGVQSHTFIRREITELSKLGVAVELFGIRKEVSDKLSADERALTERTHYLYPLQLLKILYFNLYWMLLVPHRWWPTLWIALTNGEPQWSRRLKLIYHFGVAAYMAQQIQSRNVEHIHAHFMNVSATIAMYASLLTGIPYSVTVHSAGTKNAPHIIGIPLKLKYAQFLIMISRYNIDYFDAIYPCRDKARVVRCGMELDKFPFRPVKPAPGVGTPKALPIVAVGRMVEKKGFRYLIEAAAILRDRGEKVDVEILGSGPLEQDLKRLVADLALEDRVHFFGPASTDEVRQKMSTAGVVVVPSVTGASGEMEGIPVVLMEAMALGAPVISTRHSGIPELVRDRETGLLVNERDAQALASALQSALQLFRQKSRASDDSTAELSRWVRNARELIETEYNISVVARQRRDLFIAHRNE